MRLLLHVGLGKCASSFIQNRLDANADALAATGVLYPRARPGKGRSKGHFGLSKHYGFGPDKRHVRGHSMAGVARLAGRTGAHSVILSSEFFSLERPQAIARLMTDIGEHGFARPEVLFFARPIRTWIRSTFNQYIRTKDGIPWMPSINAYLDHVIAEGRLDVAARFRAWEKAAGSDRVRLIDIEADAPPYMVLRPFERFAGIELQAGGADPANRSVPPGVLYMVGLIRQAPPSAARNRLIRALSQLEPEVGRTIPAPPGYDTISPDWLDRIAREIEAPFAALPRSS